MNQITLIGNLCSDPQLRATPNGIAVTTFTIAVNRKKQSDGQQETDFFRVTAWRQLAENCSRFLEKGKKVAVLGSVSLSTYTKKDGTGGASLEVNADQVEFLSPKSENSEKTDKQSGMVVVDQDDLPF